MTTVTHEWLVQQVLGSNSDACKTGFKNAIRNLPDFDYLTEEGFKINLLPDAFFINQEDRYIVCFECEDTNGIKGDDWNKFINLAWAVDDIYYKLYVVVYTINSIIVHDVIAADHLSIGVKGRLRWVAEGDENLSDVIDSNLSRHAVHVQPLSQRFNFKDWYNA